MNRIFALACVVLLTSCITDDSVPIEFETNILLANDLGDNQYLCNS